MEINLVTHCDHNGKDFGQWYLIADGRNIGFVIKHSWHIHITQRIEDDFRESVMKRLQEMKEGENDTARNIAIEDDQAIQDGQDRWRGVLVAELDGLGEGEFGPDPDGPANSEGELPEAT